MTTLTRWLLRAFADAWPGGLPGDTDPGGPLYLVDRDESVVLDVDTSTDPTALSRNAPTQDFDLNVGNTLGVALTDAEDTPAGLGGGEYLREPVLSVRIQGAAEREHGHIGDGGEFQTLYDTALDVVKGIDNGTLQAAPLATFYVADPGSQTPQMSDYRDAFTYTFEVQARGYQQV